MSDTLAAATALDAGFVPNRGQLDPRAEFVPRGAGYTLFITGPGAVLALDPAPDGAPGTRASLRMQFDGAIASVPGTPARPLPGLKNYLIGDDPAAWRTGIPRFAAVTYPGVYREIDLVNRPGKVGDSIP
jgi:hypothetical protein